MTRRMGAAAVAAITAALVLPAAGGAVTIGSDLKGTPGAKTSFGCGDKLQPCTIMQTALPSGSPPVKAPFRGVIRKWRFRTTYHADAGFRLGLSVVRKVGPDTWKFIRRAHGHVGRAPGIYRFDARMKVRKGDHIALNLPPGSTYEFSVFHAAAKHLDWFPTPPLGIRTSPNFAISGSEYFYNATIRRR